MEAVRPARLWAAEDDGAVRCGLCHHRCRIPAGRTGVCGVRENRSGVLHTLVYGRLVARNVDPVEKKPLFHVAPGSRAFSVATAGCNLRCAHCQNHEISQAGRFGGRLPGTFVPPEAVVGDAVATGCRTVAYTYTEPTVYFEYAADCMALAREQGLLNAFVTNGFMTPACLDAVGDTLDAANVDLKAMDDRFYREVCGGRLEPVLETIRSLRERGVWVEVTTLVIPGYNDDPEQLGRIAEFLASVDPDVPWHVTGFFPTHRLTDAPPTPAAALERARRIGLERGLRYVYTGNRPGRGGEDTVCPGCGTSVIVRRGFLLVLRNVRPDGGCGGCGQPIPGIEMGGTP